MSNPPPLPTSAPPRKKNGCFTVFLIGFGLFVFMAIGGVFIQYGEKQNFPKEKATVLARIQSAGNSKDESALKSLISTYGKDYPDPDYQSAIHTAQAAIDESKRIAEIEKRQKAAQIAEQQAKAHADQQKATAKLKADEEALKNQISDIPWKEIDAIYSLSSKTTDIVKDEKWKAYKGKRVRWKGTVSEIQKDIVGDYQVLVLMRKSSFVADVIVYPRKDQVDAMFKLSKGDPITFEATLDSWGSIMPIIAKDGVIVK